MKETFIDYLKDVHAESYTGTDDNMPEDLDNWLGNLDGEEYIKYADQWTTKVIEFAQLRVSQINRSWSASVVQQIAIDVLQDLK